MSDTPPESGVGLELGAKFALELGELTAGVGNLRKRLDRPPAQPVFARRPRSGNAVTATALILSHGGPQQGTFWYVRRWNVGGLATTTPAAGIADLFVTSADVPLIGSLAGVGLADWCDEFPALPNVETYGRGEVAVQAGEKVFTVITGGTNAQGYVASIALEQFQAAAVQQGWSE